MRKMLVVLLALGGCVQSEPRVGGASLIEADGTIPAPAGPVIVVGKQPVPAKLSGPVRLAADRNVPYVEVVAAAKKVKAAGGRPVLLVSRRVYVEALPDPSPLTKAPTIRLAARAEGKACISPPDNNAATCVSRKDQKHIDRAFVRQLLAKAVHDWGLTHVNVIIDPSLSWGDAVRAIDGARTCCGKEAGVVVSVSPSY